MTKSIKLNLKIVVMVASFGMLIASPGHATVSTAPEYQGVVQFTADGFDARALYNQITTPAKELWVDETVSYVTKNYAVTNRRTGNRVMVTAEKTFSGNAIGIDCILTVGLINSYFCNGSVAPSMNETRDSVNIDFLRNRIR